MPKCDRCGSTENVQRSLVVDMPARCLKCIDEEIVTYEKPKPIDWPTFWATDHTKQSR